MNTLRMKINTIMLQGEPYFLALTVTVLGIVSPDLPGDVRSRSRGSLPRVRVWKVDEVLRKYVLLTWVWSCPGPMPQTHVDLVKFMLLPHGEAQRDGKASTGPSINDDSVCKYECLQRSNDQPGCVNTSDCNVCLLNGTDGHCSPIDTFFLPLCCTQSTCSGFWVGVSLLSLYQNGRGLPIPSFPGRVSVCSVLSFMSLPPQPISRTRLCSTQYAISYYFLTIAVAIVIFENTYLIFYYLYVCNYIIKMHLVNGFSMYFNS